MTLVKGPPEKIETVAVSGVVVRVRSQFIRRGKRREKMNIFGDYCSGNYLHF